MEVPAPANNRLGTDKAPPVDQADVIDDDANENPILPVTFNEPVISADPVKGKAGVDGANDALVAKEALVAFVANDAVPSKLPVIPFVTVREPVTILLFCAMTPLRATNSFAILLL